jgi:TAK1-binding protein 1
LQILDEHIQGGSTAAMAVMCGNVLYTSNVGDSRILLYKTDGTCLQLTCDHSVDNEEELDRLSYLGLDREVIKRNGRIGTHENTRSFGDYNLKEGYRDVDSLKSAKGPVGTADPYITSEVYNPSWKYIVLMTDGIYKALESIYSIKDRRDVHRQLLQCIEQAKAKKCENIAENVVRNIAVLHYKTFCNKIYAPDPADRKIGASNLTIF